MIRRVLAKRNFLKNRVAYRKQEHCSRRLCSPFVSRVIVAIFLSLFPSDTKKRIAAAFLSSLFLAKAILRSYRSALVRFFDRFLTACGSGKSLESAPLNSTGFTKRLCPVYCTKLPKGFLLLCVKNRAYVYTRKNKYQK